MIPSKTTTIALPYLHLFGTGENTAEEADIEEQLQGTALGQSCVGAHVSQH